MQTSKNIQNNEDYQNKFSQSSHSGSSVGSENYKGQQLNREHSDTVQAGEHNYQSDETQYGKIRESESGMGSVEKRGENLRNKINDGVRNAGEKVNEYTERTENKIGEWADKAKNKMSEWSDKAKDKVDDLMGKSNTEKAEEKYEQAEKKMDKAEKKIDKAQEKFAKGYENDGLRKMEKAEKKMDKAEEKIKDAHEKLSQGTDAYTSAAHTTNNRVEDYKKQAGKGNPFDNRDNIHQGNIR